MASLSPAALRPSQSWMSGRHGIAKRAMPWRNALLSGFGKCVGRVSTEDRSVLVTVDEWLSAKVSPDQLPGRDGSASSGATSAAPGPCRQRHSTGPKPGDWKPSALSQTIRLRLIAARWPALATATVAGSLSGRCAMSFLSGMAGNAGAAAPAMPCCNRARR